jgi:hypothetical protein
MSYTQLQRGDTAKLSPTFKSEQTMADIYIHQVTNMKLENAILETNSIRLSTLTISDHRGHKTTIHIFFDNDTDYDWKSMTIEDSKNV